MTVYMTKLDGSILFRARAESGDGHLVGDLVHEVRPGESAWGRTYEEWSALPDGPHSIIVATPE